METLDLTNESLKDLKKVYNNAVAKQLDAFEFQGKTLVTDYAENKLNERA